MNNNTKQPAHELMPVLIAWLDDKRHTSVAVEAKMAFELAIGKTCEMVGRYMTIPEQHLPKLIVELEILRGHSSSNMVRLSLVDLVDHLKKEIKPTAQRA